MVGLEVNGLSKHYKVDTKIVKALSDVSFSVDAGSFTAVIGYSGCGKTTLFRHIANLETPDSGNHKFISQNKTANSLCLGMMFQEPRLLPWLTVAKNIELSLKHSSISDHAKAIDQVLSSVGLAGFKNAYPRQLSGGMAQRVALARALCREPDLLLMDEPFGALDALTKIQLQSELARIWTNKPMTILFITHDISEAVLLADRILVMAEGQLVDDILVSLPRPRNVSSVEVEHLSNQLMQRILNQIY